MTATSLSRECTILAPSMTRIVRRLCECELVTATRSNSDQREIEVRITPRGSALVAELGPYMEQKHAVIRERLDPEEYETLTRTLKRLIALIDE